MVFTERDDYDSSCYVDRRPNHSWFSAAVGMADADRDSAKWSVASIVRGYDGGGSGDQGSSGPVIDKLYKLSEVPEAIRYL